MSTSTSSAAPPQAHPEASARSAAPMRVAGLLVAGTLVLLAGLLVTGYDLLVRAQVLGGSTALIVLIFGLFLLIPGALATGTALWVLLRRLDEVLIAHLPARTATTS